MYMLHDMLHDMLHPHLNNIQHSTFKSRSKVIIVIISPTHANGALATGIAGISVNSTAVRDGIQHLVREKNKTDGGKSGTRHAR